MLIIGIVIAIIVIYEVGYCHGRRAHEKSLGSKLNVIRGIYEKGSEKFKRFGP